MTRRLLLTLILTIALPGLALAIGRSHEPRLDPRAVAQVPSYVRHIEPAIVALRVRAREDATSSARLGTQRFSTGVVFDTRGYAVTVSYALLDAVRIEAQTRDGRTVPARLTAIDLETGLGVVKLEGEGPWPAATLGHSTDVQAGSLSGTIGVDEDNDLAWVTSKVQGVRRFSGYWEYMLDRALIVGPSTDSWGGSAVVDARGTVLGIASLRLGDPPHVNVVVPIEKFVAVKDELVAAGRVVSRPPRPWLGLYTVPHQGGVVIDGFAPAGPAREAGLRRGDRILSVNGVTIASQEEFYEQLWRGRAGDVIRLAVQREAAVHVIPVTSIDRYRLLRIPLIPARAPGVRHIHGREVGMTPITWKDGARCAVMLSFDLDGETLWMARDPALAERPIHMSMGAYGPKTAMPRILRLLDRYGLKVAFYVPGWIIERYPAVIAAILAGGHEIGHHGYLHEKPFMLKSADEEEALLVKTLEIFKRQVGTLPLGSRTPSADPSRHTFGLLRKHGFVYHTNMMDADLPYRHSTPHGDLVELPTSWVNDDFMYFGFSANPPAGNGIWSQQDVWEIWSEEFEGQYEEGGFYNLMFHPQVMGRPSRLRMLERLIQRMLGKRDCWFAKPIDIARHCLAQG